jgi:hypothetical protein
MIQVIFLVLLVLYIVQGGDADVTMACGIFGILTKKPKLFDWTSFNILGIANDSRGGDSCGIFVDGRFDYGVGDRKYFCNFFLDNPLINELWNKETCIALGHCRKASVGNISRETAQPVVIQTKDGAVRFVLIHNGTIHNYQDLAKKYIPGVDITGMTDSQVMARIFYYKGYDCLSEYNGGGVFFIVDYRQPEPLILMYKGASKKTEYSKDVEEERPFYYCCDDGELIFSSIYYHLEALRPCSRTYSLNANVLMKFDGGKKLVPVKAYPRDKCQQNKKYVYTSSTVSSPAVNYWSGTQTTSYIHPDKVSNTYSKDGKKLDGKYLVSKYGKIETSAKNAKPRDVLELSFYKGILLQNNVYYKFLEKLRKRLKLDEDEFVKNYQVLIRYLSMDKCFFDGTTLMKATGFDTTEPFTGDFQMATTQWTKRYVQGKAIGTDSYKDYSPIFDEMKESKKLCLSAKEIKGLCRQLLMK